MNIPSVLALASLVGSTLMTAFGWGLSTSPGWRGLRWLAGISLGGAFFAGYVFLVYQGASDVALLWSARLAATAAGLFCLCWPPFGARLEHRSNNRFDRVVMAIGAVLLLAALVPGLLVSDAIGVHSPDGVTFYREAVPTWWGAASYGFFVLAAGVHAVRALLLSALRGAEQWAAGIALGLLFLGGAHDGLVVAGLLHHPYVLVSTLLFVMLVISRSVITRLVSDARALERMSEDLARTQATLVHRERLAAIGEVSAVVAHEVRNPVAVIFNVVGQLRRELPSDHPSRQLVEMAAEESQRIEQLVAELLDFTSPRVPQRLLQDVREVVRAAAEAALQETRLGAGQLAFHFPDQPLRAEVDVLLLHRAVVNLVTNALQSAGRTAPVSVGLQCEGTCLRLEIRDDGDGVPEALVERIFEPFFTTRASGTGLGLSLARQAAEAHGGSLTLLKPEGRGACFRWRMPVGGSDRSAHPVPLRTQRAAAS